jgi:DNA-binding HxlR family transcriptional regulator
MVEAAEATPEARPLRTGARVLSLLSVPLNGLIVCALGKKPMRQSELRKEIGNPAETTLRGHLSKLEELGAVRREMGRDGAHFVESTLTESGEELLVAARALESWLELGPTGSMMLGSVQAKGAVKALAGAWDAMLLRALAGAPLTLTQLNKLINAFSYPALERRLAAMRATGLAQPLESGDGTPYALTPWARQGAAPIIGSARFERLYMEDTPPPSPIDIEAAFLLATPLAHVPGDADGICNLMVEIDGGRRVGVEATIDRGKIISCLARLGEKPRNWALGSPAAWHEALVHNRTDGLRIGGNRDLACGLVKGVHMRLFPFQST